MVSTLFPRILRLLLCAAAAGWLYPAQAYLVAITSGNRSLFLQVGAGSMSGGNFNNRGTPRDNATINTVSVTVPAAALGTGSQVMTSDSTVSNSPYDGFAFCSAPAQVYVGGYYRIPASGGSATLSVATPVNLTNASADSIAFSTISWVSSGKSDATPTIPSGTFTGATQTLLSVAANYWFESCLAFRYANALPVAAGTFTGRATYTLTAP